MPVGDLVSTATRDWQPARRGNGLDQCRLPRAVLTDKERHRALEGQIEVPDERKGVWKGVIRRYTLGHDVEASEEARGRLHTRSSHHLIYDSSCIDKPGAPRRLWVRAPPATTSSVSASATWCSRTLRGASASSSAARSAARRSNSRMKAPLAPAVRSMSPSQ